MPHILSALHDHEKIRHKVLNLFILKVAVLQYRPKLNTNIIVGS